MYMELSNNNGSSSSNNGSSSSNNGSSSSSKFYVRYSDPGQFSAINEMGIILYECNGVRYKITVSRYITKTGSDIKKLPIDLEQYHNKSMGSGMGLIGTTNSMENARKLASSLHHSSGNEREFVLLYIPTPTISIYDKRDYDNLFLDAGQSFSTNFGYGLRTEIVFNSKGEEDNQRDVLTPFALTPEIVYLPTTKDNKEGILGCTVTNFAKDSNPDGRYAICDLLMGSTPKYDTNTYEYISDSVDEEEEGLYCWYEGTLCTCECDCEPERSELC